MDLDLLSIDFPNKKELSEEARSLLISTLWKTLHILFSWWNKNLKDTSEGYLNKTWTKVEIDDESKNAINEFWKLGKWIIISEHKSWVFSDYLPLFSELPDDILKKSIFYTWSYNLSMNKREFPGYEFRPATLKNKKDKHEIDNLKKQIEEDIKKVKEKWWYIFIIPSWANTNKNAEFQAIFQRFIKLSDNDLPILENHITHSSSKWYKEIWKSIITKNWWITKISSTLWKASDWIDENWKVMNWRQMREKYNWKVE